MEVKLIIDAGNDQAFIVGDVGDGTFLVGRGYSSSVWNRYTNDQYDEEGNLLPGAQPTPLNEAEMLEWALERLAAEALVPHDPARAIFYQAPEQSE